MAHIKFDKHGTPAQKLAEECAELIMVCMKIERFGLDDYNPLDKNKVTNRQKMHLEISDVQRAIVNLLLWADGLPEDGSQSFRGPDEEYM